MCLKRERSHLRTLSEMTTPREREREGGSRSKMSVLTLVAEDTALSATNWMFDQQALQEYVLICCQHAMGGLVDKPGK